MGNSDNDRFRNGDELSGAPALRVADLLGLAQFAGTAVAAGRQGLERVVTRATVMEVPDVEERQPLELVLAGDPVPGILEDPARLVSALDDAGVSALAVQLRRGLDQLPADLVAAAEHADLPLLLLPNEARLGDVLNAVASAFLTEQGASLGVAESIERTLLPLVLSGGGLTELVDALAEASEGLTFLSTPDGRVLAAAATDGSMLLLADDGLFVGSSRFRSERFPPGVHRVGGLTVSVVEVLAGADDHGRLVVIRRRPSQTAGDWRLLQKAATAAALVISKTAAVQAVEAKYRGDFVKDVLLDRAGPPDAVVGHFASLGWNVDRPLVVLVAAIDPLPGDQLTGADRASQDRFAAAWANAVSQLDASAPVVGFAHEVVALVAIPAGQRPSEVVDRLVREVSGDTDGRRSFASGVSRLVTEPAAIPSGYDQARRAVHVGRQLQGTSAVAHFDDLGAFRLLSLIDDADELRNFATEMLGEIADETESVSADMRATLRVLLDTNLNVAESSRRLHFHYNTLRYRISKLEQIVGPFTTDPDLQLDLSLALRVMQMRGL